VINRRQLIRATAAGLGGLGDGEAFSAPSPDAFRLAYFETYSPMSFRDGDRLRGILVEILHAVLVDRLGLVCREEGFPWARAQQRVERGESDAICTVATPQRLAYSVAVDEPILTVPNRIFVRADNPMLPALAKVRNLDELRALNPSILSYSANGWAKARLQDFDVTWGGDFNSAMKMLVARRGDIMVENALTMVYTLQRTPGGDAVRMLPTAMDQASFQLLISKRSPHLNRRDEISRAIRQFKLAPPYADIFQQYGVPLPK